MRTTVVLLACIVGCSGAAWPANQQYFAQVVEVSSDQGHVFNRCWNPNVATISPGGATSCASSGTQVGFESATRSCRLKWSSAQAKGYKGYSENIFNDNGTAGEVRHCVLDLEKNAGTGNHIGYYLWASKAINDVAGAWQPLLATCSGTQDQICLSPGNASTAVGFEVNNTPLGTIPTIGGFRPVPVPLVVGASELTGQMQLAWRDASSLGDAAETPLYRVLGLARTSCTPPTEADFNTPGHVYPDQTATILTANVSDFGFGPDDPRCYFFAIRLVYPSALGNEVASRYVSANSQPVVYGGLATEVYDLAARNFKSGVNLTWKSSLEEGTLKYEVLRGFAQAGPFAKVGEVGANGEASAYSYFDNAVPPASRRTAWYLLRAVSDASASDFGPVLATKK